MVDTDTSIAVVSTTCLEVPPSGYGGLELMVYNLTRELADRSYEVTCIAPQGTDVEGADVVETTRPSDSTQCFAMEPQAYRRYADRLSVFDVVIDHSWQKLTYRRAQNYPEEMADTTILGVWHGMPRFDLPPVENPNYVSVSRAAAEAWERKLGFEVRHVYNGIDVEKYPLEERKDDYVMTLNRIMPEKGITECIDVAEHLGVPMKIVGEDLFVDDVSYVADVMARCGQSQFAEYVGRVDHEAKVDLLRRARALVLLPQSPYQEVFGLAAAEAMSAGTPVLAIDNNGLGEVVRTVQGTGTYDNENVLAADLERVAADEGRFPDPAALREGVVEHFSVEAMTDRYLQRVEEAVEGGW